MDRERDKPLHEKTDGRIMTGGDTVSESPRRTTLREHLTYQMEFHLQEAERLRIHRNSTSPYLLDTCLEEIRDAAQLT